MDPTPRIAVLLSGRGSNMEAIARAIQAKRLNARIVAVISNRAETAGLEIARELGLPAHAMPVRGRAREEYDAALASFLREAGAEWVCLAGYMRLVSRPLLEAFPRRIVNIHPSLLPAFPGLEAQRQALEYGVRYSGCTVHLVDATLDGGPIVAQAVVPVLDADDEAELSRRILEQEHRLYPEALTMLLSGDYELQGRRIKGKKPKPDMAVKPS